MSTIRLTPPCTRLLPAFTAALRQGWSPNTTRDVTGEMLAQIEADPAAFLADFIDAPGRVVHLSDGRVLPRLPGETFWIEDAAGEVCGSINYRYVPGTLDLPPHVSGHVGYAVVPWKRRQGVATQALRAILPIAGAAGLPRVLVTTDVDNLASQRVILAAGGVAAGEHPAESVHPAKRLFWIGTGVASKSG